MVRPGNHVFLWMLLTSIAITLFQLPVWATIVAAFAIGWFYNEYHEKQRD